jgi:hypothetical protein
LTDVLAMDSSLVRTQCGQIPRSPNTLHPPAESLIFCRARNTVQSKAADELAEPVEDVLTWRGTGHVGLRLLLSHPQTGFSTRGGPPVKPAPGPSSARLFFSRYGFLDPRS